MHTRSNFHVRCARILRFTWGDAGRTVSTSLLLPMKIAPTFKNLHQVLALALQTFNLVAHIRDHSVQTKDLSASCRQLAKEGADIALDLQLCDVAYSARSFACSVSCSLR